MPLTNHIAIFGGSFDPPHFGHVTGILWLISALNARGVVVAPTFKHCFGKDLSPFNHRINMCKLMVKGLYNNVLDNRNVVVSDIEKTLPLPNITYNLVNKIKKMEKYSTRNFAIVVGSDLVPELHKWSKWDEVAKLAKIITIGRSGFKNTKTPFDIYQYPIDLSAVSSSEVRDKIKSNEDISGLVTHNVKQYIYENSLYK